MMTREEIEQARRTLNVESVLWGDADEYAQRCNRDVQNMRLHAERALNSLEELMSEEKPVQPANPPLPGIQNPDELSAASIRLMMVWGKKNFLKQGECEFFNPDFVRDLEACAYAYLRVHAAVFSSVQPAEDVQMQQPEIDRSQLPAWAPTGPGSYRLANGSIEEIHLRDGYSSKDQDSYIWANTNETLTWKSSGRYGYEHEREYDIIGPAEPPAAEVQTVGEKTVERLKDFTESLKSGDLSKYRVTKLVKNDDGTFTRTVQESQPQESTPFDREAMEELIEKTRSFYPDEASMQELVGAFIDAGIAANAAIANIDRQAEQLAAKDAEIERLKKDKEFSDHYRNEIAKVLGLERVDGQYKSHWGDICVILEGRLKKTDAEIERLREEIILYDVIKSDAAIRILDLEQENLQLRTELDDIANVERATLEADIDLGATDVSKCLPSWIATFSQKWKDKEGITLSHGAAGNLLHTLIAARYRAERLVKERDASRDELAECRKDAEMLDYLEREKDLSWFKQHETIREAITRAIAARSQNLGTSE